MVYMLVIHAAGEVTLPATVFGTNRPDDGSGTAALGPPPESLTVPVKPSKPAGGGLLGIDEEAAVVKSSQESDIPPLQRKWNPAERCRELLKSTTMVLESVQEIPHDTDSAKRTFMVGAKDEMVVESLMRELSSRCGIGNEDTPSCGTVYVLPVEMARPRYTQEVPESKSSTQADASESRRGKSLNLSVNGRILADKILLRVLAGSFVSFDFFVLTAVASALAGIGLATNNPVVIVAAMLVSPLMGPVLGMTFGFFVSDWRLFWRSLKAELTGLLLSVLIGVVVGAAFSPFAENFSFPTQEMKSRGEQWGLLIGIAVAIPSGAGVALSVTGDNASSLVGVAISASLLPPAVNTGMCCFMALAEATFLRNASPTDYGTMGGLSLVLSCINIVCIVLAALIIFALKESAPIPDRGALFESLTKRIRKQAQAKTLIRPASADTVADAIMRKVPKLPPMGSTFATVAAGPYGGRARAGTNTQLTLQEAVALMESAALGTTSAVPKLHGV